MSTTTTPPRPPGSASPPRRRQAEREPSQRRPAGRAQSGQPQSGQPQSGQPQSRQPRTDETPTGRSRTGRSRTDQQAAGRTRGAAAPALDTAPRKAASRPSLRLVRPPRRLRTGLLGSLVVSVVFVTLFVLAAMQAVLVQGQLRLDRLQGDLTQREQDRDRLELEVNTLESPDRLAGAAQALGMVPAPQVLFLYADPAAGTAKEVPPGPAATPDTLVASGPGPGQGGPGGGAGQIGEASPPTAPEASSTPDVSDALDATSNGTATGVVTAAGAVVGAAGILSPSPVAPG